MTQLIGLLVSTLLTLILVMSIYIFVIRRQEKGAEPRNKITAFLEIYYTGFINLLDGLSSGKNKWSYVYLFTLFNFIFINCLVPWIGFESAATSIMFTLPLALITFIMIYIIGIGTMGFIGFVKHKYSNPMEIVLQFTPLLSMSIRLFAATLAGAIIGNVPWIVAQGLIEENWYENSVALWFPVLQILFMWVWKIADTLLSLIQSFVFMTLTVIFWSMDTGPSWSRKERKKLNNNKNLDSQQFEKKPSFEEKTTIKSLKGKEA